ncbi:MAG TPA: hypothetical protein VE684_03760, partial [Crenalkalicoccus sp.]|nr:hypothetical protein [Crenalkalicoccus sp.]
APAGADTHPPDTAIGTSAGLGTAPSVAPEATHATAADSPAAHAPELGAVLENLAAAHPGDAGLGALAEAVRAQPAVDSVGELHDLVLHLAPADAAAFHLDMASWTAAETHSLVEALHATSASDLALL